MDIKKFRKKPVVIEATRWDGTSEGAVPIIDWIISSGESATYECSNPDRCQAFSGDTPHWIKIDTLEGPMRASIGDWVIKGLVGEFYACRNDVFDATYEEVTA